MNPRPEDVDALARAIDRVVFAETGGIRAAETQSASLALISYLNDSFPRVAVAGGRRERLQRRLIRAEVNRRLGNLDPRWTPVVGGAALVILGVVGFAVWRRKPAIASLR